ncbi:hypothetical protein AERO9A_320090 [Aeromonas salmonicida]|nr:hypothetical protein AERO9A_320090 [Aeromonas salmonicida]
MVELMDKRDPAHPAEVPDLKSASEKASLTSHADDTGLYLCIQPQRARPAVATTFDKDSRWT